MRFVLAFALCALSTSSIAAPVSTAKAAIKIGCASIRNHLPNAVQDCDNFVAQLRGDVWTVSAKPMPTNQVGGGAPVVEVSQETGEVLNFYLTE